MHSIPALRHTLLGTADTWLETQCFWPRQRHALAFHLRTYDQMPMKNCLGAAALWKRHRKTQITTQASLLCARENRPGLSLFSPKQDSRPVNAPNSFGFQRPCSVFVALCTGGDAFSRRYSAAGDGFEVPLFISRVPQLQNERGLQEGGGAPNPLITCLQGQYLWYALTPLPQKHC